jgi:DNA-binding response OmpR family regulator
MIKKIMVVDDNSSFASTLTEVLAHHGFTTQYADSPSKAINAAEVFHPDLAILDGDLGTCSGIALAEDLYGMGLVASFIFLTGSVDLNEKDIPSAIAHCSCILHKPVEVSVLVTTIRMQSPSASTATQ